MIFDGLHPERRAADHAATTLNLPQPLRRHSPTHPPQPRRPALHAHPGKHECAIPPSRRRPQTSPSESRVRATTGPRTRASLNTPTCAPGHTSSAGRRHRYRSRSNATELRWNGTSDRSGQSDLGPPTANRRSIDNRTPIRSAGHAVSGEVRGRVIGNRAARVMPLCAGRPYHSGTVACPGRVSVRSGWCVGRRRASLQCWCGG